MSLYDVVPTHIRFNLVKEPRTLVKSYNMQTEALSRCSWSPSVAKDYTGPLEGGQPSRGRPCQWH